MKLAPNLACRCGSGLKYKRCCRPLHHGQTAPDPETLMRSRFCAYAGELVDYIVATTDPEGPQARADRVAWANDVRSFCRETDFEALEVLGSGGTGDAGWVRFRAQLRQAGRDASFIERSRFVRRNGSWLYHSGDMEQQ